jgi:hypothetical protein
LANSWKWSGKATEILRFVRRRFKLIGITARLSPSGLAEALVLPVALIIPGMFVGAAGGIIGGSARRLAYGQ